MPRNPEPVGIDASHGQLGSGAMYLIGRRCFILPWSCLSRTLIGLVACMVLLLMPASAQAACQTSNGTVKFADSSSYTVQANSIAPVSASAGFSCSGALLSLINTNSASATITSAKGWTLLGPSGDRIPYLVSADQAGAYTFNQYGTLDYMDTTTIALQTFAPKIYLSINGGGNIAAGTYTDTLTVQWSWTICNGIGLGNICVLSERGSGTVTIPVTLVVSNDCQITAPPIVFGSVPVVSQFPEITQSVIVDCTKGSSYLLGFSKGSASSARPWRTMTDGSGRVLQYNIYRPDGITVWDESNPLASAKPGTGSTTPTQPFAYKARINPDQAAPAAGAYSDNVSVVITF
jgi:spore coat protein U-like protein